MMKLKDKIIKVAEENGWSVYIEDETEDNICFDFGKYSPAGQDFHISAELEDMEIDTLTNNLYERYSDFDVSSETYLWLDNTGHGTNCAPYDMKDLYEDMEACQEMIMELYRAFESAEEFLEWQMKQCLYWQNGRRVDFMNKYRTIKITSGMTQEFEIIWTNAPNHVIKAQLMYIAACEEEGKQVPENPYGMIEEFGYMANVIGSQDSLTTEDLEDAMIDAEFDYYDL